MCKHSCEFHKRNEIKCGMKSFSKLVQQKRVKMLVLCLFLFAIFFLKNSTSAIELTYIVRKEAHNLLPSCIGEGNERYEGIGWTYPLPENGKLPEEDSYFLPTIKNDYNCKFSYNQHCSRVWAMKNWEIDTNTTRRYDFISDERWEGFPTYYTSIETKDFKDRIEISKVFKLGFSVRTPEHIELFICEGWDPKKYSCYYFNITNKEINLSKYRTLSENDIDGAALLDSYKAFSNIIVSDEWRNFQIEMDEKGRLQLKDINLNRTMIEKVDKFPLKPAYLFFKSKKPTVWKIHKNEYFYTRSAQVSRMGPSLKLNSEDLCVNLFVASCANCTMTFFMIENGTKVSIDQRQLKKSGEWTLIRLSREEVALDHFNIFVQTAYKENVEAKDGFWAIDDVRVCHKNEVKISLLKRQSNLQDDDTDVSCLIVDKPNLRPTKMVYDHLKEYPTIESESDSSSINLTWTPENSERNVEYFIRYQANDICIDPPFNVKRMKSNGFLMTKTNKISLKDLVPYTTYNVTFSTMLHLTEKHMTVNTKESPYISLEEQPNRIQIEELSDTIAKVSWDKVDCKNIYGHIIYSLELVDVASSNVTDLGEQTDNSRFIIGLHPFTNYTLKIGTTRSIISKSRKSKKFITNMAFTTKPGLASEARNLEIYASSSTSLSLRYNLPDVKEGNPTEVHITRCNKLTLKKCKMLQQPVTSCKLFPGKYCIDVPNLIPNQRQLIKLSLKNDGSHTFGEEATIEGFTVERVPGKPTNITYKVIDCEPAAEHCNLNISWLHPYDQNGTINAFNIFLNSSEGNYNETKTFMATYKIVNQYYQPQYTYQIKRVPFSKQYDLYIQSVNDDEHKSPFTTQTVVHTKDLGDLIDQSPILLQTLEDSIEFELKQSDQRLSTILTVIVQDFDENKTVDPKISGKIELADHLCNDFGETWISQIVKVDNIKRTIKIGKSDPSGKPLKPETKYCITFLMENEYQNSSNENVYYETLTTLAHIEAASGGMNILLILLLILIILLLIVGVILICYFKKRKNFRRSRARSKDMDDNEHAYESLPFEETIVNNNMYDHLEHK